MLDRIFIYHHLGLGDHIICNAIVRHYAKLSKKIYLFVQSHNYKNVSLMYCDLNNIEFLIGHDNFVREYIKTNNISNEELIKVGFEKLDTGNYKFDNSFYVSIGMDFEKKWSDFYLPRNMDIEKKLFNSLNIQENEYIFVHDDKKRGYSIDRNKIESNLKIISAADVPCDFFDLCYTIENANQIHLMESSYKCLIEHLNLNTDKLFYHKYVRNYQKNIEVSSKLNWIVYE